MAQTKTGVSRTQTAAPSKPARTTAASSKTAVDRTAELSDEVAQSVEDGQRAALQAVRKFIDAVDHTLPALPHGEGPSRRQEIIDSALEMADRLVHTQYEFVRKVVESAGKALGGPNGSR